MSDKSVLLDAWNPYELIEPRPDDELAKALKVQNWKKVRQLLASKKEEDVRLREKGGGRWE